MVARYNRGNRLRPINRIKHVVDIQQALPVNTLLPIVIVNSQETPVRANTEECLVGSTVGSFFATVECVASETSTTATANIYIYFAKIPGNQFAGAMPNGNVVGISDLKKYVIHQEMVMINPSDGGNPRNIFKGVVKIPRGYARNGPDDRINMFMFIPSTGVAVNICAQFHYKEFR